MEDEKPDTRHLVLKPKVITLTEERARPGDGTAISVQLIHKQNQIAEDKSRGKKRGNLELPPPNAERPPALPPIFKPKEIVLTDPRVNQDNVEAISVPDILLENRIAEQQKGWWRVKRTKKRASRRNRDFLLIVGVTDLAIVIIIKVLSNTMTTIYGIAGITLVTTTVGWVMFVVNDDY
jgi:hypothetical protein